MSKILCNNCSSKWLHWQLKLKSWPNNSEQRATVKVAHDRQGIRHRNKRHSCVITTRDSATKHVSARHPVVHKQKQFREMSKTAVNRSHQWSWGISSAPCYRQSNNFSRRYRRGHLAFTIVGNQENNLTDFLYAVNSLQIKMYGQKILTLDLGIRRITCNSRGWYLTSGYRSRLTQTLRLYSGHLRWGLIDKLTQLIIPGFKRQTYASVKTIASTSAYHHILADLPESHQGTSITVRRHTEFFTTSKLKVLQLPARRLAENCESRIRIFGAAWDLLPIVLGRYHCIWYRRSNLECGDLVGITVIWTRWRPQISAASYTRPCQPSAQ